MRFYVLLTILLFAVGSFAQDKNYSEWYLVRPGVEIYVREVGRGKDTVVVVHGGFGANHDYMLDAIRGMENDFRFVLYDQRGSLMSPAAKEDLTFDHSVEDLHALVKELRVGKVKLFAHSMGTLIAMEFIKRYPKMVDNVVLVGAVISKSENSKSLHSERVLEQIKMLQDRKEVQGLLQKYRDKGDGRVVDNAKGQRMSVEDLERSRLSHKELTEAWRIHFAAVNIYDMGKRQLLKGGKSFYKGIAGVKAQTVDWNYDYRKALQENGRTTLIQGGRDFLDFDAKVHKELLSEYPAVNIEVIKNAGHNVWVDKPKDFYRQLRRALRRN